MEGKRSPPVPAHVSSTPLRCWHGDTRSYSCVHTLTLSFLGTAAWICVRERERWLWQLSASGGVTDAECQVTAFTLFHLNATLCEGFGVTPLNNILAAMWCEQMKTWCFCQQLWEVRSSGMFRNNLGLMDVWNEDTKILK